MADSPFVAIDSQNITAYLDPNNGKPLKDSILDQFLKLYEEEFSAERDQFVEPLQIVSAVHSETYLLAYQKPGERVAGGIVFDYYPDSECCLLSYIFVDKSVRGAGIGTALITDGMTELIDKTLIKKHKKKIKAVFFETENPHFHKKDAPELEKIFKRLRFFRDRAKAKHIDIPYVQAEIPTDRKTEKKSRVYSLYLMVLPVFGEVDYGVLLDTNLVLQFLRESFGKTVADPKNYTPEEFWFEDDIDLLRIELSLKISDLLENVDPLGLHESEEAKYLYGLQQRIERNFLSDNRDNETEIGRIKERFRQTPGGIGRIDSIFYLKEIPSYITPKFELQRCSVALHIVEHLTEECTPAYCPILYSYEQDSLSQRFEGSDPPFKSKCFMKGTASVTFKNNVEFTSEGRRENFFFIENKPEKTLRPENYVKPLRYFLNYTYFKQSGIRIWELIFSPETEAPLNEFELIQLVKYFTGRQEKYTASLKFVREPSPFDEDFYCRTVDGLFDFLSRNFIKKEAFAADLNREPPASEDRFAGFEKRISTGTIQVDTKYCRFVDQTGTVYDIEDVFRYRTRDFQIDENFWQIVYKSLPILQMNTVISEKTLFEKLYNEEIPFDKLPERGQSEGFETNESLERIELFRTVLDMLCGICIGIFDFERMEYEEVVDTLLPEQTSATNTSLRIMNKGVLVFLSHDDELYGNVLNNIGISPYELLISSALSHNFRVALLAQKRAEAENREKKTFSIFEKLFVNTLNIRQTAKLDAKEFIETKINVEMLPNVFQYPSDQATFDVGMGHRGIDSISALAGKQKEIIESELEKITKQKADLFQLRITLIGLFLAFLQLAIVFLNTGRSSKQIPGDTFSMLAEIIYTNYVLFIIIVLGFLVSTGYYYYRKYWIVTE